MKTFKIHLATALTAAIVAGCTTAPLDPATLPAPLASRLTPSKALSKPKQSLIVGKWDLGDGTMELMRGGRFRIRLNNGSVIDATGRVPRGASGTRHGKVLSGSARWVLIESPQGDRLRFNFTADNPHGYANPNLSGGMVDMTGPRASSFEFEILFVNDDCFIYRAPGSLGVGLRVR